MGRNALFLCLSDPKSDLMYIYPILAICLHRLILCLILAISRLHSLLICPHPMSCYPLKKTVLLLSL